MKPWWKSLFAGILTFGACLALVAWSSGRQQTRRRNDLHRETELVAQVFAARLRNIVEKHVIALGQMTTLFENSEVVTEAEFARAAAATLKSTPLCLRIPVVDASFHIRRVYPLEPNRPLVGFDVRTHPEGYATLLRARDTGEPALSPPLELIGGGDGFMLAAPIVREGRFTGALMCTIPKIGFFESLVLPLFLTRYEENVLSSGVPVFSSPGFDAETDVVDLMSQSIEVAGSTWEVQVSPRNEVVDERLYAGHRALWVLGWLLALAAGGGAALLFNWASVTALRLRIKEMALRRTQQQLDSAMRQMLESEKLTALGELVAGVAHEINNPLSSIMGYSQLMIGEASTDAFRRRLRIIHGEAERMASIVKNLLSFARRHAPEKKYLNLNDIIDKTLELKAYHIKVSQITVEKDLDPALPKTMLDFHQMQQVILNLLNNAEQVLQETGRGGTIRLKTRRRGERIEACVEDDGPGIPSEIQSRIFDPFFTTKVEGKGTGLGLSLCYGIVSGHEGTIRVESQPGRGARFLIDLPIQADEAARPEAARAPSAPDVPRLRILVVDDEPSVRDLLVEILNLRGHAVDTAADVPEALTKLASTAHDLVISDMKMPRGTGGDLYREILQKDPALARRVVFMTGDGASARTRQILEETGNQVVMKPFKMEDIDRAIARALLR